MDSTSAGMGAAPPPAAEVPSGEPTGASAAAMPLGSALADEGLKKHQGLAKFKDVDSLAKSYVELEKFRNDRSGVKPLTADSTADEVTAYRTAMGIPEKPEGYELGDLAFPEGNAPTQEQLAGFRGIAHELHLSPAQVQGILTWYSQDLSTNWNALNEAREAEVRTNYATLQQEYGAQAPQLVQMAAEYLKRRFGQEALDSFEAGPGQTSALGNNPYVVRLLIESAKLTGHDKFIIADSAGRLMDQEAAKTKIAELRALNRDKKISPEEYNRQFEELARVAYSPT